MKYRFITKLVCRIMAIYFFVIGLNYIPNLIVNLVYYSKSIENLGYTIFLSLSMSVPMLISSIFLWMFDDSIAKNTVKESVENQDMQPIDYKNIAIVAFVILGMFILINSIPAFVTTFIQYKQTVSQGINQGNGSINIYARMIGDAVKILLSILLILGSRGIANVISAFRNLGMNTIDESKQ